MSRVLAIIPTDVMNGRLGHARDLSDQIAGMTVLEMTVRRVLSIESLDGVVLVYPEGQNPLALLPDDVRERVQVYADPEGLRDRQTARLVAARKWAVDSWRGGLGFATGFDELLPAGPLARAAETHGAQSVLLVRGDWPLFDTGYARELIELHQTSPEHMKVTLTQAPPGLGPLVMSVPFLTEFAEHGGNFGSMLGYNSHSPAIDPIGREVTVPISPKVRDCRKRLVYDTPRSIERLRVLEQVFGDRLVTVDADRLVEAIASWERDHPEHLFERLPQQVNLELTPRRPATGPITPQAYVAFERPDLELYLAERLVDQLGEPGDVSLLLGGLGDAMEYPEWDRVVMAAHEAGVMGIGVETDLLSSWSEVEKLLDLPLDLVIVRINADSSETYKKVMGQEFGVVTDNLQRLFNERRVRRSADGRGNQVPWIVPRLVKVPETLSDMESFFERWLRAGGYAMIQPSCSGCGLMPELSPVPMEPPRRVGCKQLGQRMSVLSDGVVALCDQDWQGRSPLGDARIDSLLTIWRRGAEPKAAHDEGRFHELTICGSCKEWHRP
ncbi:MAG: SPASM domain-containing protein [Phycisphaeraceae bacterium]